MLSSALRSVSVSTLSLPGVFYQYLPIFFTLLLFMEALISEKIYYMFSFESLDVYKKAFAFNQNVYELLKQNKTMQGFAKNQLGRASLSIMLNIAEGSAKFSLKDRKNFFSTARGSVFECASLIDFMVVQSEIQIGIAEMKLQLEQISKMLYTMIKNLESRV